MWASCVGEEVASLLRWILLVIVVAGFPSAKSPLKGLGAEMRWKAGTGRKPAAPRDGGEIPVVGPGIARFMG